MHTILSPKYKLHVRPDTCDELVCGEIERSYKLLSLVKGDVVLDVGANIGAFSAWAAPLVGESGIVIGYEPDVENFQLFNMNTLKLTNTQGYRVALLGDDTPEVEFFTNDYGRNKGLHSLVVQRGRGSYSVPAMNLHREILRWKPSKLKIDTEGGEYDMLLGKPIAECVKTIALEIHLQKKSWRYDQAPRLIAELEAQFPIIRHKAVITDKTRALLGVYARE
jgi:FkbM family methyltransferase